MLGESVAPPTDGRGLGDPAATKQRDPLTPERNGGTARLQAAGLRDQPARLRWATDAMPQTNREVIMPKQNALRTDGGNRRRPTMTFTHSIATKAARGVGRAVMDLDDVVSMLDDNAGRPSLATLRDEAAGLRRQLRDLRERCDAAAGGR